jgi:hypothetical protein
VAAAAVAFAAAASPSIRAGRGPVARVLLHDASASCGARALPDEDEIAALLDGLGPDDRVAAVSFGRGLGGVVALCAPSEFSGRLRDEAARWRATDPGGSSMFRALDESSDRIRQGPEEFSPRRFEIVLATDGRATDGPDGPRGNVAARLRKRRLASLRVLRRPSVEFPSLVAELRGPGAARAGEPFTLTAVGVAKTDDAVVGLSDATGVLETRRVPGAGPFRLAFTRIEEKAGPATFTARVVGATDAPWSTAHVAVTSPGRALVVGAARRAVPGLDADWRDVRDVRRDASTAFAEYDAVVFDDVRSAELDESAAALRPFVEHGGGVVLLGGPDSFGAGGWAGREIEKVSPLVARPRDENGTFLYLALDGSGSMAEAWSGAPGAATRDGVARNATKALLRAAAEDTTIAARRFSYDLLPPGAAAVSARAGGDGRGRLEDAVDALPAPGGATALLPPMREALSLASSRGEKKKRALILTDGRTPERAEDLHAALVALDAARIGVTFVLPGDAALDDEAHSLKEALVGTKAEVRGATTPEFLADAFRDVEEKARVDEPVATERRLALAAGAAGIVDVAPESAARIDRTWLADGARALVVSDKGEPVAAIRRVGLGTATALATRPGDAEWLAAGEKTSRLVASLVRAAMRPASGRVRVERDGETRILVRYEPPPGGDVAAAVAWADVRAPLVPSGGGLFAADLPVVGRDVPEWIGLVAADGRVLATVGLDTPAPAEYRDPPPVDLDAFAALACGDADPPVTPLLPWLAAAAVSLCVAAIAALGVKSRSRRAR